jgi:EAL domain-containing protein (putative c-di-GMP-specific phosphodiesterase class I)
MEKTMPDKFQISDIIEGEFLTARYQPIISLKRKALIGFAGLSRGIHPQTKCLIPPPELFFEASQVDLTLALDRLCRKKVLEHFKPIHEAYPDMLLTLNFDASVIDQGVVGSGNLLQMVKTMGYKPANICIEIIESNVKDLKELQKFVDIYREHGFLIALNDVGGGHSNLNRIPLLKPDILKIDHYLIDGIQDDFYKQQIFKSMVFMARTLGTMIIAEGVETKEEALTVLQLGVDMIQGFYFSMSLEPSECLDKNYTEQIKDLALAFRAGETEKISVKRIHNTKHHSMIGELQFEFSKVSVFDFDQKLARVAGRFPNAECFYILDEQGIQVSETFFNDFDSFHRNKSLFRPAPKGTDHTMKNYYYLLIEGDEEKTDFITEPYLSMASGNMCVTISALFRDALQKRYVLCVDIKVQNFGG